MSSEAPTVSVILPVYNAAKYLRRAMESILGQTFTDLELIVVDDGSTDGSADVMRMIHDGRVKLLVKAHAGIVSALNMGLEAARGEFIARQDADDYSHRRRLEMQVRFLAKRSDVGVCGTDVFVFSDSHRQVVKWPHDPDECRFYALTGPPVCHATVMMRKALLDDHGLRYSAEFPHAEDFELWSRMVGLTGFANVRRVLYHNHMHGRQVTQTHAGESEASRSALAQRQLSPLGVRLSDDEVACLVGRSAGGPVDLRLLFQLQLRVLDAWPGDKAAAARVLLRRLSRQCGHGLGTRAIGPLRDTRFLAHLRVPTAGAVRLGWCIVFGEGRRRIRQLLSDRE